MGSAVVRRAAVRTRGPAAGAWLAFALGVGLGACSAPAPEDPPQREPPVEQASAEPATEHATASTSEAGLPDALRVVSYNIRHGRGMDDSVDLARTAAVLRSLTPDLVGLQEVDRRAERSGGVDQATELGRMLEMVPVFGAFMEYQGGHYGMAILSRFPPVRSWTIPLPEGNEPRVALAVMIPLPAGDTVVAVNVHFDWVDDDGFRFAQASVLAAVLDTLSHPWVLLGDLNDEPGSRTLALFAERAREAAKPANARFTFSTDNPRKEIDFIFGGPPEMWGVRESRVVAEPVASDHRPVLAVLEPVGR